MKKDVLMTWEEIENMTWEEIENMTNTVHSIVRDPLPVMLFHYWLQSCNLCL